MRHATLLIIIACSAVGCRPKAKAVDNPQTAAAVVPATQNAHPAPVRQTNQPGCQVDSDCEGYLRCEDATCKVPPAVEGRFVEGMPTAVFTDASGQEIATFNLEIADDNDERMRGLMFRRKMHADFGMLFIFDTDAKRSFWMKNTLIPLDMVHINAAGEVVGVVARAEPMTLSPRATGVPARYVLEIGSGLAEELGIVAGTKMALTGVAPAQSPTP